MYHPPLSTSLAGRAAWRLRNFGAQKPRRDDRTHQQGAPLVVAGMFRTESGIGQSARACSEALRAEGFHPVEHDVSALFGQVDREIECEPARLPDVPGGTLILHLNAPETPRALFELRAHRRKDWRVIGYWAWELSKPMKAWLPVADLLSEIWTPSEFVSDVFRGVVDCPVETVPHYVRPDPAALVEGGPSPVEPFEGHTCLVMADGRSSFTRKNVSGGLEIFRRAFQGREDVRLIVKSRNLSEFPQFKAELEALMAQDRRISVLDANLDHVDRWRLLGSCDTLISAHRSEGFGLPLAEAMSLGRNVLATNWSGNTEFMTEETSLLMDYSLVPVEDTYGIYGGVEGAQWAEPDLDHGARLLRQAAEEPEASRLRSARAKAHIIHQLSSQRYVDVLKPL